MEIDMIIVGATNAKKKTTIMDITTLLDKGIHISDLNIFHVDTNKT